MEELLKVSGLSAQQAKVYLKLLEYEYVLPSEFAIKIQEARSNTYKILDDLVAKGLAIKIKKHKKIRYKAENPIYLSSLAREEKDKVNLANERLEKALPELISEFNKTNERPGIEFFEGKTGIEAIYHLQLNENKEIQFFQTKEDKNFFGFDFMHKIRNLAPKAGIKRKAFTRDAPEVPIEIDKVNKQMLLERTWYMDKDYTAPVEWSVFGDKVSIISFGKEAIGTVITSPQIAESLRQLFQLLDEGLKRRPGYNKLPQRGEFLDAESFIAKYHNKAPDIK